MTKKDLLPQIAAYKDDKGVVVCFRWMGKGFDFLKKEGFYFLQIDTDPVSFICKIPKDKRPPLFLVSSGWKTKGQKLGIRYGITKNPLDLAKPWRKLCRTESRRSKATTMIETTNYTRYQRVAVQG